MQGNGKDRLSPAILGRLATSPALRDDSEEVRGSTRRKSGKDASGVVSIYRI